MSDDLVDFDTYMLDMAYITQRERLPSALEFSLVFMFCVLNVTQTTVSFTSVVYCGIPTVGVGRKLAKHMGVFHVFILL